MSVNAFYLLPLSWRTACTGLGALGCTSFLILRHPEASYLSGVNRMNYWPRESEIQDPVSIATEDIELVVI
ncbi:hypothetical protein GG344DRAFT_83496 [Lentinula edodes]|nr:hypothetical protein GG344DRAFT_83496 [Lentinula edodes]